MFKSRKEVLEAFLKREPCLKAFLLCDEKELKIKNYYVNPGMIKGFERDSKKPLIKIRFTNFTYSLDLTKGD